MVVHVYNPCGWHWGHPSTTPPRWLAALRKGRVRLEITELPVKRWTQESGPGGQGGSMTMHQISTTTPLKLNVEPENRPLERRFLLETIIFRFHVKLWVCSCFEVKIFHHFFPNQGGPWNGTPSFFFFWGGINTTQMYFNFEGFFLEITVHCLGWCHIKFSSGIFIKKWWYP